MTSLDNIQIPSIGKIVRAAFSCPDCGKWIEWQGKGDAVYCECGEWFFVPKSASLLCDREL